MKIRQVDKIWYRYIENFDISGPPAIGLQHDMISNRYFGISKQHYQERNGFFRDKSIWKAIVSNRDKSDAL